MCYMGKFQCQNRIYYQYLGNLAMDQHEKYYSAFEHYSQNTIRLHKKRSQAQGRAEKCGDEENQFGAWKSNDQAQSSNILSLLRSNLNHYEQNYHKFNTSQKRQASKQKILSSDLALGSNKVGSQDVDKQNQGRLPVLQDKLFHRKGRSMMFYQSMLINKIEFGSKDRFLSKNVIMIDVYRNLKSKYSDLFGSKEQADKLFVKKQKFNNISKTIKLNMAKEGRSLSKMKDYENYSQKCCGMRMGCKFFDKKSVENS